MGSTDTVIRFCDNRVAYFTNEIQTALIVVYHVVTGHRNADTLIIFFHAGFVFDAWHVFVMKTARNIEICTQTGILLQPVFIIGFQPVNATVMPDKVADSTIDLVIVFQAVYFIIFLQAFLKFRAQVVIRTVADTEDIHTVFF